MCALAMSQSVEEQVGENRNQNRERERGGGGRLTDQERGMERGKTREVEREHG